MSGGPDSPKASKAFTIVMRGPSAVVFRPHERFTIQGGSTQFGPLDISLSTRWRILDGVDIPGHLLIEIKGHGPDLETVLGPFASAGLAPLALIATCSNAAIGDPEVEVAFDCTSDADEHDYFQSFVGPESQVPMTFRFAKGTDLQTATNALFNHPEQHRLNRALNHYRLALGHWKFTHATLSMAHLWMAVEALTKARLRLEIKRRGLRDDRELAASLDIEIKQLDATIRRDFILSGDNECYTTALKASDGFEHGFMDLGEIRDRSKQVRHRLAKLVRESIFDVMSSESDSDAGIREIANRGQKALGHWPLALYLRGTLTGPAHQLAMSGGEYPSMRWLVQIRAFRFNEDGTATVELNPRLTAEVGNGVTFTPQAFEAWEPG